VKGKPTTGTHQNGKKKKHEYRKLVGLADAQIGCTINQNPTTCRNLPLLERTKRGNKYSTKKTKKKKSGQDGEHHVG
jgi:hypothetical protein